MTRKVNIVVFFILFICWSVSSFAQQPADKNRSANLDLKIDLLLNNTSFDHAIVVMRSIAHINILADGESIIDRVNLQTSGTVREVLDILADTFDYKWRMSQGGIILMTKRFQGSKQLPQIHLAEMQQMSRDINNALTLTPKIDYATAINPKLRQLLLSLSPEQYGSITGDQPFYIRDLPRKQMETLIECMLQSHFTAAFRKWETLPSLLNGFPRSYLTADPSLTHGETTIEDDKRITKMYIDVLHIVRDNEGRLHSTRLAQSQKEIKKEIKGEK